jgi:hypothetical protein
MSVAVLFTEILVRRQEGTGVDAWSDSVHLTPSPGLLPLHHNRQHFWQYSFACCGINDVVEAYRACTYRGHHENCSYVTAQLERVFGDSELITGVRTDIMPATRLRQFRTTSGQRKAV